MTFIDFQAPVWKFVLSDYKMGLFLIIYPSQDGWSEKEHYESQSTSMGNISRQTNSRIQIFNRFVAQDLKIYSFVGNIKNSKKNNRTMKTKTKQPPNNVVVTSLKLAKFFFVVMPEHVGWWETVIIYQD